MNISELSHKDLMQINGGVDQVAYNTGYAVGQIVGKSIRQFLTMTGIYRVVTLFL
jgi:bacteriocin-like protein